MKRLSKLVAASLLLASSTAFAVEPAEGWYAGFMAGASYAPSTNYTFYPPFSPTFTPFITTPVVTKLSYHVLANGAGQVGFRCNKFRYEGELVFNTNNYNKLNIGGLTIDDKPGIFGLKMEGNTSMVAGIFNVFYEFYDEDYSATKWVPYIGAGLGYAYVRNKLDFYLDGVRLNLPDNSRSNSAPIGQAIAGISYFFNDNISLGTDLRYMGTRKFGTYDARVTVATWNLLMNFSFDQPAY